MRILAIGDIHGYADVLRRLLDLVQPTPEDQLITVGDYVDRGPDSRGVLDLLIPLHEKGQLIAIRGNHDFMMSESRKGEPTYSEWQMFGGQETLESYGEYATLDDVPDRHWRFLEEDLIDWYELETHFFVHAQVDPNLSLVEQSLHLLHWESLYHPHPHRSGKVMICGHTSQKKGVPRNWGHAVCIDTWVYGDGWLTCLDVLTGEYWQTNQKGETRHSMLSPPHE